MERPCLPLPSSLRECQVYLRTMIARWGEKKKKKEEREREKASAGKAGNFGEEIGWGGCGPGAAKHGVDPFASVTQRGGG